MDTFTATPSIVRLPITVLDVEKYEDWMQNGDLESPPPTITRLFVCYEKGPGTPVPVQIEIDQIEQEYTDHSPTDEDFANLSAAEYVTKWRRVNMLLRRNMLLNVVRGLDPDSANVLAHEDGAGREILQRLGWIQLPEEAEKAEIDVKENAEGEGNSETGESISSISPQSTQVLTSSRKK